jgi:hypothetical protein
MTSGDGSGPDPGSPPAEITRQLPLAAAQASRYPGNHPAERTTRQCQPAAKQTGLQEPDADDREPVTNRDLNVNANREARFRVNLS